MPTLPLAKKEYPVTEGSVRRMENAAEVLVKGNKVSFTVYHGKKDFANDVRPAPPKVKKEKKPKIRDISMLSPELQALVAMCEEKLNFDIRQSILSTLNQTNYVNLPKREYIEKYLVKISGDSALIGLDFDLVIKLIDHFWSLKRGGDSDEPGGAASDYGLLRLYEILS